MPKFVRRASLWILFGLVTGLCNIWAHQHPEWIERWYSRWFFQAVRWCFDHSLGQLPFPSFYLFWIGVLLFGLWAYLYRPALSGWKRKAGYWLLQWGGFAGLLFGLFFWLWGFNYARQPFAEQLNMDVEPLDSAMLWQELRAETQILDSLRHVLTNQDTIALNDERYWPLNAEDTIRTALKQWLNRAGFPAGGRVRGRFIYPEGTLFKFGASGIYWPFIGEGNLEAGMHPLRKLPAMAHEMSHGFGFSDEGVCNFIAYVACCEHPNPYIAYCTRLDYWDTLASACLESDPSTYEAQFRHQIPAGIVSDQRAIRRQHSKFKELAPTIRYEVYDSYLKAQGISKGMLNYDEVLMLVRAWRLKQKKI